MAAHRVLIVDDHPIVRHGIAQLLAKDSTLDCSLQADDADAALQQLRAQPVDLVIVDISMPGLSGLDLTRRIASSWPTLPVLVLSMHEEAVYAERAFAAGARGYLTKQGATERLLEAVHRMLGGSAYFSPAIEQRMLAGLRGQSPAPTVSGVLAPLNEREFEVLQMLAQGLTSQEMAQRINRSIKSIEAYRASLRTKLGARSLAELTKLAIDHCAR